LRTAEAESRREEVLFVASRVIMREGLEGASLRKIAREGGFTTGVLTHYFLDKRELIRACFEYMTARFLETGRERLAAAGSAAEHMATFIGMYIPREEEQRGEWRLWFELCAQGMRDRATAATLVETDRRWEALIADSVAQWQQAGLIAAGHDPAEVAIVLGRLIDGLCLRALVTGDWDEACRRVVLELRMLGLPDDEAQRLHRVLVEEPS
jgi:AcrR family transcriptional regulator